MACRVFSVIRTNNDIKKCFSLTKRFAAGGSSKTSQGNETSLTLPKNNEETFMEKDEVLYRDAMKATVTVSSVEDVGLVSGVPEDHIKTRKVRIFCPPKNAMQSGTNNIHFWQIDFDTRERWENSLIGWTSTGDPMSNLKVEFATEQEAIAHCEKMGWDYYIQKPNVNNPKPRNYGSNFAWNKRTRVSTK
ncbi:NADH dehydrogenase [ubiquinone] iron-sulfur protein 4, mitochondrial isoform X2 [Osmia bicornis bicornis]|nr:NADH dehydrogenase [ubiquinone] iron-sulfur protein 4, mitochondrial isoform X2 [Osmia bicornis bicornis]XP_029043318.1 NADH dehydrogenase [ubiquinone] iron-sulfur protein 4, mitochondrial isoform X2 [Osmia bicornis bicornis]